MLWAGVPFITVRGDNWPSRVATSIAEASQVKGMVVENLTEYENRAVELAENPTLLKKLKESLSQQKHTAPLFDSKRWVRNFESGLQEAWKRYNQPKNLPSHNEDLWVQDIHDDSKAVKPQAKSRKYSRANPNAKMSHKSKACCEDKGDGGRHQQEDQLTRARTVYKADDSVVARYSKSSLWYAAVVLDVREDGVIKIKWGDGDKVSFFPSLIGV